MKEKYRELWKKYKDIVLYIVFGGATTVVNILVYDLLYGIMQVPNTVSTAIAWVISVIFAYITNKFFVFESKGKTFNENLKECISFFACRAGTGLLDMGIMYQAVDYLHRNAFLWKVISNVLVIVINYFASKVFIFASKKKQ